MVIVSTISHKKTRLCEVKMPKYSFSKAELVRCSLNKKYLPEIVRILSSDSSVSLSNRHLFYLLLCRSSKIGSTYIFYQFSHILEHTREKKNSTKLGTKFVATRVRHKIT